MIYDRNFLYYLLHDYTTHITISLLFIIIFFFEIHAHILFKFDYFFLPFRNAHFITDLPIDEGVTLTIRYSKGYKIFAFKYCYSTLI